MCHPQVAKSKFLLADGRWLFGVIDKDPTEATEGESTLERTQMGMRGGYPIFKERGHLETWSVVIHWSDDDGKSWREGEPIKGPFKWACPATWHFIERPDGEIWLPMNGCVTDEEVDSYSGSNCIIRSRDRGGTWGDSTLIFQTNPPRPDDFQSAPRFTEKEFVVFTAVSHRSDASAGVYRWIEN